MGTPVEAPSGAPSLPESKLNYAAPALAILLMLPAALTAYYRIFMGIKPYHDEGALISMTRDFLAGHLLYDAIPSMYGPTFFFYQWLAHALTGAQVTTDSVRFISVAFWVGSSLVVFAIVYRGTRSWALAAATYVVAFRVLTFIGDDPSHPQELCMFL